MGRRTGLAARLYASPKPATNHNTQCTDPSTRGGGSIEGQRVGEVCIPQAATCTLAVYCLLALPALTLLKSWMTVLRALYRTCAVSASLLSP